MMVCSVCVRVCAYGVRACVCTCVRTCIHAHVRAVNTLNHPGSIPCTQNAVGQTPGKPLPFCCLRWRIARLRTTWRQPKPAWTIQLTKSISNQQGSSEDQANLTFLCFDLVFLSCVPHFKAVSISENGNKRNRTLEHHL